MTVPTNRLIADRSDPDWGVDTTEVVEWVCGCRSHLVNPLTFVGRCDNCGESVLSRRMRAQIYP